MSKIGQFGRYRSDLETEGGFNVKVSASDDQVVLTINGTAYHFSYVDAAFVAAMINRAVQAARYNERESGGRGTLR